ncbi:hypothetical protein BD410DRAFT_790353 [Rickenella mellea]|uniref:Uncharacterized protein n=1 Tax=Rickenella mellea TaxID=50990 RepID=A0A4Y7Q0Q5_9AGAM|nr:hypothetical protein BD410DRAFT_790353 [Rickenella mellea]
MRSSHRHENGPVGNSAQEPWCSLSRSPLNAEHSRFSGLGRPVRKYAAARPLQRFRSESVGWAVQNTTSFFVAITAAPFALTILLVAAHW